MGLKKTKHPGVVKTFKKSNSIYIGICYLCRLLIVPLGLFVGCSGVGAQEIIPNSEIPISLVLERGPDEASLGLDGIFMDSLAIELELAGFKISNTKDPAILIRIAYMLRGTRMEYSISAEVLADGKLLYDDSSSEELSLELDTILLKQARDIAGLVKEYVDSAMPETPEEVADDIADITETSVDEGPAVEGIEGIETADTEETTPEPARETTAAREAGLVVETSKDNKQEYFPLQEAPEMVPSWLALEADVGVFLAGGEAGRYFDGGYTISTLIGYRFPYYPGIVLGGSLGCMYFMLEGYSAEARGLAILFGPGLRLESEESNDFVPGLSVNAGAALLVVFPGSEEPMAKIVPAAEAAMTVGFVLEKMTLYVQMGAKVFLEGSSILYGFVPGIGIQF
jgi:hypothetical protein